jgi:hypothetical protein
LVLCVVVLTSCTYVDESVIFSVSVYSDSQHANPINGITVRLYRDGELLTVETTDDSGKVNLTQTVHDPYSQIDFDEYFSMFTITCADSDNEYQPVSFTPTFLSRCISSDKVVMQKN